jgi:hypothetical protein
MELHKTEKRQRKISRGHIRTDWLQGTDRCPHNCGESSNAVCVLEISCRTARQINIERGKYQSDILLKKYFAGNQDKNRKREFRNGIVL